MPTGAPGRAVRLLPGAHRSACLPRRGEPIASRAKATARSHVLLMLDLLRYRNRPGEHSRYWQRRPMRCHSQHADDHYSRGEAGELATSMRKIIGQIDEKAQDVSIHGVSA
jgi:hypothetical protein